MNLVDIKFNKEKSMLIVLDYEKGVFAFDKSEVQMVANEGEPYFVLNPNMILKKQCNLMEFS